MPVILAKKALVEPIKFKLTKLISPFCKQYLDDEYDKLCEKMIDKMARKQIPPFLSGKLEVWAASIIYAIGQVNFLFDKSSKPHVSGENIATYFKVSQSTIGQKAKTIRDMFKMSYYNEEFLIKKMQNYFPKFGMTESGFIITINKNLS